MVDLEQMLSLARLRNVRILNKVIIPGICFQDIGTDKTMVVYISPLLDSCQAAVKLHNTMAAHGIIADS